MPDIVISEFMDFHAPEAAAKDFDVHDDPHLVDKPEELKKLGGDTSGVFRVQSHARGYRFA